MTTPTTQREADERAQKALAAITERLAVTYRICCGTSPKQSVGELLDVTIKMPEWEIVRAAIDLITRQAALEAPECGWCNDSGIVGSPPGQFEDCPYCAKARASLTPTAPQAASQQAETPTAWIAWYDGVKSQNVARTLAEKAEIENIARLMGYDATLTWEELYSRAPQAATTASACPATGCTDLSCLACGGSGDKPESAPVQAAQPALPAEDPRITAFYKLRDIAERDEDIESASIIQAAISGLHWSKVDAAPDAAQTTDAREGWLPIETAPKDGTEVLLYLKEPYSEVRLARWFEPWLNWIEGEFPDPERDEHCGIGSACPSHWMPLPSKPTDKGQTNE